MAFIKQEWALLPAVIMVSLLWSVGGDWLDPAASGPLVFGLLTLLLLVVILITVFAVVRHADELAERLGEPYGTLVLTLSVVFIEVMMISMVMLTGKPNPAMARETMYAVVMLVLNGLVGVTLLAGGWRYHSQYFNLFSSKSYLIVILPLALLCLVLPNFTESTAVGTLSRSQQVVMVVVTLALYGVFLVIQTRSHSEFFRYDSGSEGDHHFSSYSTFMHALLLVVFLLLVVGLAKKMALPVDYLTDGVGAPSALAGLIVAILVLAPEAFSGLQAALNNQLQRAMNIYLGSVLATIALTVPAVLLVSQVTGLPVVLGVSNSETVLLVVTLLVTHISLGTGRTNVLNGATHLVLFFVYLMLLFD